MSALDDRHDRRGASEAPAIRRSRTPAAFLVWGILAAHVGLLVWGAFRHSPVFHEVPHLPAGISHWHSGCFDLYRVNPPLVRMVAAIPSLMVGAKTDWSNGSNSPGVRPTIELGRTFALINGASSIRLYRFARLACIPISLLGAIAVYSWSSRLYGRAAGMLALVMWSFSPMILGNGQLIMPDAPAASLGLLAQLFFWQWLRRPTWNRAFAAGVALGIAELTKFTWIILFPSWLLLWLIYDPVQNGRWSWNERSRQMPQLAVAFVLALTVVNLGYGFEGSFRRLDEFPFISNTLAGDVNHRDNRLCGNRFHGHWLGALRVPLPNHYVLGIDVQKKDFEERLNSYLRGRWRKGGWWYYYLYALAVKVPLGTWCLMILAVGLTILNRGHNAPWRDEIVLLLPGLLVLVVVSSQTGFSIHSRYVLPALPFFYAWASKVAWLLERRPATRGQRALASLVIVAITGTVGSSLWTYPHSLSYFNELVGGPRNGGKHLLNSNMAWGQDLLYLKSWLDKHPSGGLDALAYWGTFSPTLVGLPEARDQQRFSFSEQNSSEPPGSRPGRYAVSVNHLYAGSGPYPDFLDLEPMGSAGYSIYIYDITPDEANRFRRRSACPERAPKRTTATGTAR